jgi:hypothetical protein
MGAFYSTLMLKFFLGVPIRTEAQTIDKNLGFDFGFPLHKLGMGFQQVLSFKTLCCKFDSRL